MAGGSLLGPVRVGRGRPGSQAPLPVPPPNSMSATAHRASLLLSQPARPNARLPRAGGAEGQPFTLRHTITHIVTQHSHTQNVYNEVKNLLNV